MIRLLAMAAVFIYANAALSQSNYYRVILNSGIEFDVPHGITIFGNQQTMILDAYSEVAVQGMLENMNSDLPFAANFYDDRGRTIIIVNIRVYPEEITTQDMVQALRPPEVQEVDNAIRAAWLLSSQQTGASLVEWSGTSKEQIGGKVALITKYSRYTTSEERVFKIHLIRILDGSRSFTMTIGYFEPWESVLLPVVNHMQNSLSYASDNN